MTVADRDEIGWSQPPRERRVSDVGSNRAFRAAGAVLLLGVALSLVGSIAAIPVGAVGSAHRAAWILVHLLVFLGAAASLLGLPALYVRQSGAVGLVGLVGFALTFVGYLGVGFFVSAVQTFLLPWVYDKASCDLGCHLLSPSDGPPLYGWFSQVESLATFVGLIVLGLVTARAAVLPRGAGYLMAIAGVLALPTIVVNMPQLVGLIAEVLALASVAWMATALLGGAPGAVAQPGKLLESSPSRARQ